jgi:signal transduction histidine kinase
MLSEKGDEIASSDGALFKSPIYQNKSKEFNYLKLAADTGWSLSLSGYAIYTFRLSIYPSFVFVLHGLKINGYSTTQGKLKDLSIKCEKHHIEQYIKRLESSLKELDGYYKGLIRKNIHEIRGINSGLVNAAYQVQSRLERFVTVHDSELFELARNVTALSKILTTRIDYMDFIANPTTADAPTMELGVYKKFDKIQKCFQVTAKQKNQNIQFGGSSNLTLKGPPIFDIIPYLLIENALKYAPDDSEIRVRVFDTTNHIKCTVESLGPEIEHHEMSKIFSLGYRGSNASKTGKPGDGLGLNILKLLVEEVFGGKVIVKQEKSQTQIDQIPYCLTIFEIRFPTAEHSTEKMVA